jgi:hypothetical protein
LGPSDSVWRSVLTIFIADRHALLVSLHVSLERHTVDWAITAAILAWRI